MLDTQPTSYLGCLTGLQGGHGNFCVLLTYSTGNLAWLYPRELENYFDKPSIPTEDKLSEMVPAAGEGMDAIFIP